MVISGVYILPHKLTFIYKTHIESIVYIINEFPDSSFKFYSDYNIPEISLDRDING